MNANDWFVWPAGLALLILAPVYWAGARWCDRLRIRRLQQLAGNRATTLAQVLAASRRRRRRLTGLGLLMALLAAAQPRWGEGTELSPRGVDVVLCLDVSRSMLARDVEPDRLGFARRQIRALAAHASGDRVALVAFAGDARLMVPLTRDLESMALLADQADPLSVARGGTDIGAALTAALDALDGAEGDHRAVILLTDGEDLAQRGLRAAAQAVERGVVVHCLGLGSTVGSKITVTVDGNEQFLRDASGAEVVSAMDPDSLRAVAEATGGRFVVAANEATDPLVTLFETRIERQARREFAAARQSERANRFQWPLFLALVLWLLASSVRRAPEPKQTHGYLS